MSPKRYWLMKSEPDVYGIADLERDGRTGWNGVRNYQARNSMRDDMRPGDLALFYHSNAAPSGVAGVAEIVRAGYPDPTQFEKGNEYWDAKATRAKPIWYQVDVGFVERFPTVLSLAALKAEPRLENMKVVQRGQRLSVQPVTRAEFDLVRRMARG